MPTTGIKFFLTFLALLGALQTSANELVVEGSALIVNSDIGQARELATRRALASASEQKKANVSSSTLVRPDSVHETVQVRSMACTENAEKISEKIIGNELTVMLRVSLVEDANCSPTCRGAYTNRIVVTGFAMEFPEQKLSSEQPRLSQITAVELARKLKQRRRLLTDFSSTTFPYASPARAPEPYLAPTDSETRFSSLGKNFRAQYVLSGVYRDFGIKGFSFFPTARNIEIEAFLHDSVNGDVLARKTFSDQAVGSILINSKPAIGSSEFYQGDLGRVWGGMLDDIAAWAEAQAACLPLSSRVINVSGKTIHIDSGAESGLSAGDTLNLHSWKEQSIRGMSGRFLGKEKRIRATVSIRAVYPKFSVVQISDMPTDLEVKEGDILYVE